MLRIYYGVPENSRSFVSIGGCVNWNMGILPAKACSGLQATLGAQTWRSMFQRISVLSRVAITILGTISYSSIARRTSVTVAAIGFNFFIRPIITSGSFNPWPVTVQTIRLVSRIFWNEYAASSASQHLKRPAIDAALAGSTKIPSCSASQLCAARMSSSLTTSIAPCDSTIGRARLLPARWISDSNR